MPDTRSDSVPAAAPRLEGWKEIARYLNRDVSTVQRWEKQSGLPVHRHRHGRRGVPYAFPAELDQWWGRTSPSADSATVVTDPTPVIPGDSTNEQTAPRGQFRKRLVLVGVLGLVILSALTAAALRSRSERTPAPETVRLHLLPPDPNVRIRFPTVSPDGRRIVFGARSKTGAMRLWIRGLAEDTVRLLPDSDDARLPFWSPDATAIGYFAHGVLRIVDVETGATRVLAQSDSGAGGAWSRRGIIVFAPAARGGLFRIPAGGGGIPEPVTRLAVGEESHRFPQFLTDDEHFVFSVWGGEQRFHLKLGSTSGEQPRPAPAPATFSQAAAPPGYLIFGELESLVAQPFDAATLRPVGQPRTIADHVAFDDGGRWAFSVSNTGVLVYATERPVPTEFVWVDRAGHRQRSVSPGGEFEGLALSHDRRHLVSSRYDPSSRTADLWSIDTSSGSAVRLTHDPDWADSALWTPDDRRLVFSSARNVTRGDLFIRPAGPEGTDEPLLLSNTGKAPQGWTAEGRLLFGQAPFGDLWEMPLDGDRRPRRVLEVHTIPGSGNEVQARLSPDGRLIAWSSNVTGQWQVFVDVYPPSGRPLQVSANGGNSPRWTPSGRELSYRAGRTVMSVVLTQSPLRLSSAPAPLFTVRETELDDFVPTGDGFILNVAAERTPPSTLNVVLNWDRR